jgi:hypothetical protein
MAEDYVTIGDFDFLWMKKKSLDNFLIYVAWHSTHGNLTAIMRKMPWQLANVAKTFFFQFWKISLKRRQSSVTRFTLAVEIVTAYNQLRDFHLLLLDCASRFSIHYRLAFYSFNESNINSISEAILNFFHGSWNFSISQHLSTVFCIYFDRYSLTLCADLPRNKK